MTLTGNIRKYWTLRKTGKQEPSRSQSTQKNTSQIFGNQYYQIAKQRKQPPKLLQHQTESAKVRQRVWFRTGPHPESTNQKRPYNTQLFDPLQTHKYHTHTHSLQHQFKIGSFRLCQKKHIWSNAQNYSKPIKFNLFKY